MAIKAYSYIRMSRPEQIRGDSLRRQLDNSRAYAEAHGLDFDDSLRDLGLSAYSGAHRTRGALGAFLALIEQGKISQGSILIVESLDRLSREAVIDAQAQFTALIQAGITIVTLSDNQTYNRETIKADWSKLLSSLAVMARAHEESSLKGQRLAEAWDRKRSKAATKPLTARCPAWLRIVDGQFEAIEDRAAIVRRIFDETCGGLGKRAIVARLNKDGVLPWGAGKGATKQERGWQPSYVSKLLASEAPIGVYQPHKMVGGKRVPAGDPVKNYFPAVVTDDVFWQARSATKARRKDAGGRKGKAVSNLFSGLARCKCGGTMAYLDKGPAPKGGVYLACDRSRRGLECQSRTIWRYDRAERAVLQNLGRMDLSRVLGEHDEVSALSQQVQRVREQLETAEAMERGIVEAFSGKPTDAVVQRLRSLEREIKQLRKDLNGAEAAYNEASHGHADITTRLALIDDLRSQMTCQDGDGLYRLRAGLSQELRRVVRELRFSPEQIVAFYRVPGPQRSSSFALPDSAGHYLIRSGDDEAGDHAELYAVETAARRKAPTRVALDGGFATKPS